MYINIKYIICILSFFFLSTIGMFSYAQNLKTFIEYGVTIHKGENIPLWQVSNQHGLSSINNNTYIRLFFREFLPCRCRLSIVEFLSRCIYI